MKKVLVVDDEISIVKGIKYSLEQDDMQVDTAYDGEEAVVKARENEYDIILLDIMLPVHTGLEVCQMVREFSDVPIIMLTAKGDDMDKILGLEYGADDYITKPFNPLEVSARVKSQLRRYLKLGGGVVEQDSFCIGGIELNDKTKEVFVDGNRVSLTPKEYDILHFLMANPGTVFSPKELYQKIWKEKPFGTESTVSVHIRHLREKIEIDPANPRYIKVIFGQGYKIEKVR